MIPLPPGAGSLSHSNPVEFAACSLHREDEIRISGLTGTVADFPVASVVVLVKLDGCQVAGLISCAVVIKR